MKLRGGVMNNLDTLALVTGLTIGIPCGLILGFVMGYCVNVLQRITRDKDVDNSGQSVKCWKDLKGFNNKKGE